MNGEVAFEDEIAAVLDLMSGVETVQIHSASLPLGELRPQQKRPVIQALADHLSGKAVGGALEGGGVVNGEEGIVVLSEADLGPVHFLFDEGVAVEIVGGLEREECRHAHHHRPQRFVPQVEIVVHETAALLGQDAVVGIIGGELGLGAAEAGSLLHGLEDEVDAVLARPLHAAQPGAHVLFLANSLLRPFHRRFVIAGE